MQKLVAININDSNAVSRWRESNRALLANVGQVRKAIIVQPDLIPPPEVSQLHLNDDAQLPTRQYNYFTDKEVAPPRPPLPGGDIPPPRPPPPETDDEDEMFMHAPQPNPAHYDGCPWIASRSTAMVQQR